MDEKIYKSYRQLLTVLRSRGMDIPKGSVGSRVIRILERENYYNVINGYKDLFILTPASQTQTEQYKPGTSFDEIYALYCFDRDIREIYLRYLLRIENSFKTVLAHEFSALYGHDNYLKLQNFEVSDADKVAKVTSLIGDIQKELARQMSKHNSSVTHYMTEYGYIPLWVLVNVLTFGKVAYFYRYMKENDKMRIARHFGIPSDELHKYVFFLDIARNKCAHDERFFDLKNRAHIRTSSIRNFSSLNIPRDANGNYANGTNDLYALAIIFAQMLSKSELKEFIASISSALLKLKKNLKTISINDVLACMGFHSDWKNLVSLASSRN